MAMTMPSRTRAAEFPRVHRGALARESGAHLRVVPQPVTTRCDSAQRDPVPAIEGRRRAASPLNAGARILAGLSLGESNERVSTGRDHLRYQPRRPRFRSLRSDAVEVGLLGDGSAAAGVAGLARPVSAGRLSLTRRGRVLVGLIVTLSIATLAAVIWLRPANAALPSAELLNAPRVATVTVEPGQTLWQIAEEFRPGVDPRDVVIELREVNSLANSSVRAGQQLLVPLGQ